MIVKRIIVGYFLLFIFSAIINQKGGDLMPRYSRKILTQKQQDIYDFIVSYYKENKSFPSYRKIAKAFGFTSIATVYQYVQALIQKGYVVKNNHGVMSVPDVIQEVDKSKLKYINVPIVDEVEEGVDIVREEVVNSHISIPEGLFTGHDLFAYRARTTNEDLNIMEGDCLICSIGGFVSDEIMYKIIGNRLVYVPKDRRDMYGADGSIVMQIRFFNFDRSE